MPAYLPSRARSRTQSKQPRGRGCPHTFKATLCGFPPTHQHQHQEEVSGKDLPPLRPLGFTEPGRHPAVRTGNNQIAWLKIATLGLGAGSPSPPSSSLLPPQPGTQARTLAHSLHLQANSRSCQAAHARGLHALLPPTPPGCSWRQRGVAGGRSWWGKVKKKGCCLYCRVWRAWQRVRGSHLALPGS